MAEHWHETIEPHQEPHDVDPKTLPEDQRQRIQVEIDELLRREKAGEQVGH